jgi:hypothetical protein
MTVDEIVARYVEARGGAERWRQVETLRLRGSYSAFSFRSDFTLIAQRGDLYRLDFDLLESPAIRARDGEGPWGLHKLLWPEPTRVDGPYKPQMERESSFGPLLLDYESKGIAVESAGAGEVDGRGTTNLLVTLTDGQRETWFLDAESFLEVAIDSQVVDFTQAGEPVAQRTFFDDFRDVDGLVLPHQIDLEFNHRLESMTVKEVEVNPEIDPARFSPPPASGSE